MNKNKKKNILATGQVTYNSTLPQSSPNQKQKESAQKIKQINYYKRLKEINKIAKMLSPDGKLYADIQKKVGLKYDEHMKGLDKYQNKIFKDKLLKDISSMMNMNKKRKNALGSIPKITSKKKAMDRGLLPKKKKPLSPATMLNQPTKRKKKIS